ncbi:hypothetical protein FHS29_001030 [Saccharothrix tamanrassetensis]|uniref:SD-repeat containing protein B domain-containing protein n=1 Tax=Saccharothrix tamanrassetensis TaxID=1051531 RepID=A0A841CBV2_9PSEU|nr:hypothetical protein [Saccharothrix tamanrassetensis]MBB5954460.1 hypothetical protein [Saccharothrix tamanrassetensis]
MKDLRSAAALTAALMTALTTLAVGPAGVAGAQEDSVVLEGQLWFDRNENNVWEWGEPVYGNSRGVRIVDAATRAVLGEFPTDASGRYRAEGLPKVDLDVQVVDADVFRVGPARKGPGTVDFGLVGGTVEGRLFVDQNEDGVRQPDEHGLAVARTLRLTRGAVELPSPEVLGEGGYVFRDLPAGEYVLEAADRAPAAHIAAPLTELDVDPVTRRKTITVPVAGAGRADVRYVWQTIDFAMGTPKLTPAKDTYALGDEVELTVPVTNLGPVADRAKFTMFRMGPARSVTDSLVMEASGQEFGLREVLQPGGTVEIGIRYVLDSADIEELHLFSRPNSAQGFRDSNVRNNHAIVPIKLSTGTTPTSATSATSTAAATPTTAEEPGTASGTVAAPVAVVSGGGGLASTGVAPGVFVVIGGLLVGGGALAYLAARRRRRA